MADVPVSLATVCNTLNQFSGVGILRQIGVGGSKTYFDTNMSEHHHFLVEGENEPRDIKHHSICLAKLPTPPEGTEITRVEVIIRLRQRTVPT